MSFFKTLPSGKIQVIKDEAFCTLLNSQLPPTTKLFTKLIEEFDDEIHRLQGGVSREALSNAHGDWYEWLIGIAAWNHFAENKNSDFAALLPNINQVDVASLYVDRLKNLIDDLRTKVAAASSVQLITSNPDFVIISNRLAKKLYSKIKKIKSVDKDVLQELENIYKHFIGQCDFNDIKGFVAVKTSFRPDRRLQIPHEGSLMKALYTHLQTREWIINPKGLRYYAVATEVGDTDREALRTVATHSITTVHSLPQAAVDDVFQINSLAQAQTIFHKILF